MVIKPKKKRQLLRQKQPGIVEDLMVTTGWSRERIEVTLMDLQAHGLVRIKGNKLYVEEVV